MVATVVGTFKKPWEMDGKRGVSGKISLFLGDYDNDELSGAVGSGSQYIELKCSPFILDQVSVTDVLNVDTDDQRTRVKSAMIQIDLDGGKKAFVPLE